MLLESFSHVIDVNHGCSGTCRCSSEDHDVILCIRRILGTLAETLLFCEMLNQSIDCILSSELPTVNCVSLVGTAELTHEVVRGAVVQHDLVCIPEWRL